MKLSIVQLSQHTALRSWAGQGTLKVKRNNGTASPGCRRFPGHSALGFTDASGPHWERPLSEEDNTPVKSDQSTKSKVAEEC